MTTTVLVPLRDHGKTRLAATLAADARAVLAAAMLADVVAAAREATADRVVVLAAGPWARAVALDLGVDVMVDDDGPGAGLSAAVDAASRRLGGDVLVVAADLPTLRVDAVRAVLAATAPVVVAPTRRGGTGGLLRRPASAMPAAYGPGSAARHLAAASAVGLRAVRLELAGFAVDVDTPDDVGTLDPARIGEATRAALDAIRSAGPAADTATRGADGAPRGDRARDDRARED